MAALVKPEFGPSLPELAGPRLHALPRWVLWAAAGLSVVVVAGAVAAWLALRTPARTIRVSSPVAFSVSYPSEQLRRLPPAGSELVRLASPPGAANPVTLEVSRVVLPPHQGLRDGVYPLTSQRLIEQMRRADPTFILRGEQPAIYNRQYGYQIFYQTTRGGRTWYGRRILLFPEVDTASTGVDINAQAARSTSGGPTTVWEVAQTPPLVDVVRSVTVEGG